MSARAPERFKDIDDWTDRYWSDYWQENLSFKKLWSIYLCSFAIGLFLAYLIWG